MKDGIKDTFLIKGYNKSPENKKGQHIALTIFSK